MNKTLNSITFPNLTDTYKIPPLAEEYSQNKSYHIGDYVTYRGSLYKCKTELRPGSWDSTQWEFVYISSEIKTGGSSSSNAYISYVYIYYDQWIGNNPYTQEIFIEGLDITENSKISLQPTIEQFEYLKNCGVEQMVIKNTNGNLTLYCSGQTPPDDMKIQCYIEDGEIRDEGILPSEFKFVIPSDNYTQTLNYIQSHDNAVLINFGDGTEPVRSVGTNVTISHVFESAGTYKVRVFCESGQTWSPGHGDSSHPFVQPNNNLIEAKLGTNVLEILDYAFDTEPHIGKLQKIEFLGNITSIGSFAFNECHYLTSIVIPDSVTSIGNNAFEDCVSLTSIVIPDSVISIGEEVFMGCSLSNITIPDSVTSIGDRAFCNCLSLTNATIGNGVTSISKGMFQDCTKLTNIIIPDNVTNIERYAFFRCSTLATVTIGNGVITIGYGAFEDCKGLIRITIPDSVTSIGDRAFYGCFLLRSASIGNSLISIGEEAFFFCQSLQSVTIPSGVTSIGYRAFGDCASLTSVTIPASVTSIGDYAFKDCDKLTSVTLEDGITSIAFGMFLGCSRLNSIIIPNSVTSIKQYAFYNCYRLTAITCYAISPPSVGSNTLYGVPANCAIYVPSGSVLAYRIASGWSARATYIQAIPTT